jgi:succinyl-diaminopimelate desuccinylase
MSRDSPLGGSVGEVCLALVATPSESGDEAELATHVETRCADLGVRYERLGNAVVARTGDGDDGLVALVGHLDTVPAWPGHAPQREGDRVIGRGASDMKGGVAVMLRLLERFAAAARPLVFVFYDREEGPNQLNGIHAVLGEARLLGRPGFAIVLEPTANDVHAGAVGTLNAEVVFHGRSAHAARPWEGRNAITAAAGALQRLAEREARPRIVDGLRFHDTICVTTAEGGVARNVVPDTLRLGVNVRVAPGRSLDDARAELEQLVGPEATSHWLDESPPALPSLSEPTIAAFLRETGLAVHPKQAWTDVATLHAAGIPALNLGPGEPSQAHQPGEWVSIAAMERCEALLGSYLDADRP